MKKRRSKIFTYIVVLLFVIGIFGVAVVSFQSYNLFSNGITGWAISTLGATISATFISPTPSNGTSTTNTYVETKVNVTDAADLATFIYNWNGANYTFYDNNLVLMMNFDNVSALGECTILNQAGCVMDLSKYGNNGTLGNVTTGTNPTWNSSGKYNGGYTFDGTNDMITFNNGGTLNFIGDFTISAWVNTLDNYGAIISMRDSSPAGDADIDLMVGYNAVSDNPGKFETVIRDDNHQGLAEIVSSNVINDGIWHMVVFMRNGSTIQAWVDGVSQGTNSTASGPITSELRIIGSEQYWIYEGFGNADQQWLNGTIDEVKIWNRSLSTSEIQQLYLSNFRKFDNSSWEFYANQTSLTAGNSYTYFGYAEDTSARSSNTGTRTVTISSPTPPAVPEFGDYAILLILVVTIGGFFVMKSREN